MPTLIRTDFVAAVNEILTNGYLHGTPPLELILWRGADHVECRVKDRGSGQPDPAAGYRHHHSPARAGAGLWLARQLCDDLDIWRDHDTFTVRVATATTADRNRHASGAKARAEIAGIRTSLIHQRRGGGSRPGR